MQKSADVVRMAGSNPGLKKRFAQSLPFLGDLANVVAYLYPDMFNSGFSKPPTEQDVRNAVIIGGGGAAASLLTGGLDAIPAIAQHGGQVLSDLGFDDIDPLVEAAKALNVENYLREYAYSMNPDQEVPDDEDYLRDYKKLFGIN